ncbi:hypothetical protein BT69DRAFT_323166 [Atractiella rhizophila]|nr:hypothetical protein BT69DRAFT_323166 [Atractiella rhizophila]
MVKAKGWLFIIRTDGCSDELSSSLDKNRPSLSDELATCCHCQSAPTKDVAEPIMDNKIGDAMMDQFSEPVEPEGGNFCTTRCSVHGQVTDQRKISCLFVSWWVK